jgi:hypothetical protein
MEKREHPHPQLLYLESDIPPGMTIDQYRAHRAPPAPPRRAHAGARSATLRALTVAASLARRT